MGTLIIFGIFILAAVTGGFFLGHYKREGKLPDVQLPNIKEAIAAVMAKEPELTKEELKANSFFN